MLAAAGCVERRLIVRSDPGLARVFVDGEPHGETPAVVPFTYYGTREVVVRAADHRTVRVPARLSPPWWQLMPLDFVTEVLIPWRIVDEHVVDVKLERAPRTSDAEVDALKARAEERRGGGS